MIVDNINLIEMSKLIIIPNINFIKKNIILYNTSHNIIHKTSTLTFFFS